MMCISLTEHCKIFVNLAEHCFNFERHIVLDSKPCVNVLN